MAPVLLCPECGTKHPLDNVSADSAFPCSGCGRTLKVPAQAREMSAAKSGPDAAAPMPASPPPPPVAAPPAHETQVIPAPVPPAPLPPDRIPVVVPPIDVAPGVTAFDYAMDPELAPSPPAPKNSAPPANLIPPRSIRFLLWIVAVPLAFLVVFGLAKVFGLLSTNDITDVALSEGWSRFWPIVRLLPFVAIATALFVTGGVYGIARLRQRGQPKGATAGGSSNGRRPPRQASRTGA